MAEVAVSLTSASPGIWDLSLSWWAAGEWPPVMRHLNDLFLGKKEAKKGAEHVVSCAIELPASPPQWDNYPEHHPGLAFCADFLERFLIFSF